MLCWPESSVATQSVRRVPCVPGRGTLAFLWSSGGVGRHAQKTLSTAACDPLLPTS